MLGSGVEKEKRQVPQGTVYFTLMHTSPSQDARAQRVNLVLCHLSPLKKGEAQRANLVLVKSHNLLVQTHLNESWRIYKFIVVIKQ